jgi:hypothetical protein
MTSLDANVEAASSDVSEDVIDQVAPATEAENAASSPATESDDKDMLSIVRDVVDKAAEPKSEAVSQTAGEEVGDDEKKVAEADDEFANVPFNKHPRFKAVITERNNLRGEINTLKPDADRYRNVQTFLDQNSLTAEDASELLIVGALMKSNPVQAWERIKPRIQQLLVAAGEIVPEDIQPRVQNGELSHEAALELSRARARADALAASQSFREQREAQQSQQNLANSLRDTAQEWVNDRTAKDPNFNAKQPLLEREITFLQAREGVPRTPEGVKAQLAKAYKSVNEMGHFAAPTPVPAARKQITPVRGGQVAGNQRPAETSTLDIIRARAGR